MHDNSFLWEGTKEKEKMQVAINTKVILLFDHFDPSCHPYIVDVIYVKVDGHYGYQSIDALLGMVEESIMNLFRKISQ